MDKFRSEPSVGIIRSTMLGVLAAIVILGLAGGQTVSLAQDPDPAQKGSEEFEDLDQRAQEWIDLMKDFDGNVRPDLYRKAVRATREMKIDAKMEKRQLDGLAPGIGGVVGVQWTQIGPAPLRIDAEQNFQGAGPDSGEVIDIAIDPRNSSDDIVYIATNQGGVWRTMDGGDSWRPMTDYMPSLSVGAVALDPGNPSIVYAGTGNLFDGAGVVQLSFKALGLYRSNNMGETWTVLNPNGIFNGNGIHRIVFPAPGTLLVATGNGLFRSVDGGLNFGNNAPAFDNGVPVRTGFISFLKLDTANPMTVHAAVSGQGIFRSTDGGVTFPTNLFTATNGAPTGNVGFVWFDQSTMPDNQTFYASVGNNSASYVLTRSLDYGATWNAVPDGAARAQENGSNGCQCGYDQTVGIDPVDPNRVYLAFQEMYCSSDGTTFATPACTRNQVHWDHHAITFSPANHRTAGDTTTRIWIGTDGGVHYSDDGGSSWANPNEGIGTTIFFGIDIGRNSAANNAYTYGGCQDTGTVQHQPGYPGTDWHLGIDGDGGPVAVDPFDPTVAYGSDNGLFVSTSNAGNNWSFYNAAASGLPNCRGTGTRGCGVRPAVDPNDSAVVYALSGNSIYQSQDTASTFTAIGNFTTTTRYIGTSTIDSNLLWVGLNDGTLRRTNNALAGATANWTTINIPGAPNTQVRGIAIDPSNTDTVVVVYPGFCGGACASGDRTRHVYMTTDNGSTWADISGTDGNGTVGDLPDLPVMSVVIDPGTNPHSIIVSTITSVMRSSNLGMTWEVLGVGLPTVHSRTLAIDPTADPTLLRIGTYGRSVFELTSATGPLLAVNGDLSFGPLCLGSGDTRVVQLFNVGSQDLHINAFFRATGSTEFQIVSGPSTPVTIPPGEEVDYTIRYMPIANGDATATFQINSDDPFNPQTEVYASGLGANQEIATVIADMGDFGDVCLGTFKDLDLTIQNSGSCGLEVTAISASPGDFDVASIVTFPVVIGAGDSLSVPIRFEPTSLGAKAETITVISDDPDSPSVQVDVSGNVPAGDIRATGSTDFGDVCGGDLSEKDISVCNVGGCNLDVMSAVIDCADFTIINNPFPAVVSPDFCMPLTIRFTPQSMGMKMCTLTITSDDPDDNPVLLTLTGNTPAPMIDVPPDQAFPPEVLQDVDACTTAQPFPVSNTGICPLEITDFGISGNPTEFSLSGLPSFPILLDSGHIAGDGNLNTVFGPVALDRARLGELSVTYVSDSILGTQSTVTRDLCGEGARTGARVLVRHGGIPLTEVKSIKLHRINANRNGNRLDTIDQSMKLPLQTITPASPCAPFMFHKEYSTVGNPIQLLPGSYQITVQARIGGKNEKKTVGFDVSSCDFNPTVVVDF